MDQWCGTHVYVFRQSARLGVVLLFFADLGCLGRFKTLPFFRRPSCGRKRGAASNPPLARPALRDQHAGTKRVKYVLVWEDGEDCLIEV